ncbi:DNA polymerase IV [Pelosinus sp. sgz500959]|uniref:DNA polymerase IV n=1 Tax=Pelosinus sp. sgz500959 TaxID=3242472 RepID=UPI00366F7045
MANTQHRWILHIDMDAYFASIEQRDHPAYRDKPVIIGGLSGRGVVSTASYEARVYGVRSAMPMTEARRRCPEGIFLMPNMDKYAYVSDQIRHIFEDFSPLVEPLSMDEAFLDVTGMEYLYPDATDIARQIKAKIKNEINLTASAGVATNKFLAKLASDLQKPNGLVTIHPGEEISLLAPMPVHKLWGVGHATANLLKKLQIETINDFRHADIKLLEHHLGIGAIDLYNLAWGRDSRPVIPDREAKSIGNENTFERDLRSLDEIKGVLIALSEKLGWRLRKVGLWGRTITLKIRFSSFRTVTRSITLPSAISLDEKIYQTACEMLQKIPLHEGVRLLGITVSKLGHGSGQLSLFDESKESNERQEKITAVMDKLKDKFGERIITRGRVK